MQFIALLPIIFYCIVLLKKFSKNENDIEFSVEAKRNFETKNVETKSKGVKVNQTLKRS